MQSVVTVLKNKVEGDPEKEQLISVANPATVSLSHLIANLTYVAKMQDEVGEVIDESTFAVDSLFDNAKKTFDFLAEYKKITFLC